MYTKPKIVLLLMNNFVGNYTMCAAYEIGWQNYSDHLTRALGD